MNSRRLLGLALLALGACGFQLRGWDQRLGLQSVYLDARPQVSAAAPLRQALRAAGAQLASSAADAQLRVELLDERRSRRTVSVAGGAVAAEYELTLAVRYAVRVGAAKRGEPRWAEAGRVYAIDRDSVAGSAEEQALIEAELMEDIVQEILRALNAAAAELAPEAAEAPGPPRTAAAKQAPSIALRTGKTMAGALASIPMASIIDLEADLQMAGKRNRRFHADQA